MVGRRFCRASLAMLAVGCLLPAAALRAEVVVGDSIEWATADADLVVRGKVSNVAAVKGPDGAIWEAVTVGVAETVKGEPREDVTFIVESHESSLPQRWRAEGVEMLFWLVKARRRVDDCWLYRQHEWALRPSYPTGSAVRLNDTPQAIVCTMDAKLVTRREEILSAARAAAAAYGADKPTSCWIDVPASSEAFQKLWHGSSVLLNVPVCPRLERLAREWATSDEPQHRTNAARVLRHFKSDQNIAVLKALLADPASYTIGRGDGRGFWAGLLRRRRQVYPVRQQACDVLREWGVEFDPPVLERRVP